MCDIQGNTIIVNSCLIPSKLHCQLLHKCTGVIIITILEDQGSVFSFYKRTLMLRTAVMYTGQGTARLRRRCREVIIPNAFRFPLFMSVG